MEISGNTSDLRDCEKTSTPCTKTMKAKKIRWMNKFKLHPRMHTHTVYHVQFTFSITCLMCIHVKTSCKLKTHVTVRMLWICVFFGGGSVFVHSRGFFLGPLLKTQVETASQKRFHIYRSLMLPVCPKKHIWRNYGKKSPFYGRPSDCLPSKELTYPTLGKGNSSSKWDFGGIC